MLVIITVGGLSIVRGAGVDLNHNEECLIYCTRMLFLPQTAFFPLQALILVEVKK